VATYRPTTLPLVFGIAAAGLVLGQVLAQLLSPEALLVVQRKEGPVELVTLVVVAGAAIAALRYVRHGAFFGFWLVCCVVFAMEETSWLREVVHYEPPGFMRLFNAQGDTNFHNRTSWGFDLMLVFRGSFALYFVVLPWIPPLRRHRLLGPLLPHRGHGVVFVAYALATTAAYHLLPSPEITSLTGNYREEAWELVAALTILFAVLDRGWGASRSDRPLPHEA